MRLPFEIWVDTVSGLQGVAICITVLEYYDIADAIC